jgi:putative ABC transport system ATP-binding protein
MALKERNRWAMEVMEKVGVATHARHKPTEMSGGQQQRVGIARALVTHPQIVFADEPTGNLDTTTSAQVMKLLTDLFRREETTFVLVSHDTQMSQYTDRTIRLLDGKIAQQD